MRAHRSSLAGLAVLLAAGVALGQDEDGLPAGLGPRAGVVSGPSVDLRTAPQSDAPPVARLGAGEHRVTVLGEEDGWAEVRLGDGHGTVGYLPAERVRAPASEPASEGGSGEGGSVDLAAQVERYLALLRDPERFHAGNATEVMRRAFEEMLAIDPAAVDMDAIDRDPEGLVRALFEVMLALDARMAELHAAGRYDEAMGAAKRRVLRGVRFLRERILARTGERQPERLYEGGRPGLAAQPATVEGLDRYHWTVHPNHFARRLEGGGFPRTFFLLNVGKSVVSSAIARSASVDNMFSHFSVAHRAAEAQTVDGVTYPPGTWFTIEALIEAGVTIRPIAKHFGSSAREVIFFVRDRSLQPAVDDAAEAFFAKARDAINRGEPLGYDFSMGHARAGLADHLEGEPEDGDEPRLLEASQFFCSGVGEAVGQEAGVELFTNRSRLEAGRNSRALFESWGVDPDRTVPAPGDADVSATLLRVAEGADVDALRDLHLSQAALQAVFRWMDEDDYALRTPGWLRLATGAVGLFNDSALDLGLVPSGMTADVLRGFIPMQRAGVAYYERLRAENEAHMARHGRSMTPREMDARLDAIRDEVEVDDWFVRGPGGRYELEPTWYAFGDKPTVELRVRWAGDHYAVRRRVLRDGELEAAGRGAGERDGEELEVTFSERRGEHPPRITYTFENDGAVEGHWRVRERFPRRRHRGGAGFERRSEAGRLVE